MFLADKGYDVNSVRRTIATHELLDGIIRDRKRRDPLPPPLPKKKLKGPWVVERTHAWMHAFAIVRVSRERHRKNYRGMLHFTIALVTLQLLTGGRGEPAGLNRWRDHREEKGWGKSASTQKKSGPISQWTLPRTA